MKRLSMSRRIWSCLALIGLACVALTVLITVFLFHRAFSRQLDRDLARTAEAVATTYEHNGVSVLEEYVALRDTMRLTLIEPDGTVLYDSSGADALENHLNRPEVQQALTEGHGAATRNSCTLGYETHYYALRLSDGNILRLSDDSDELWLSYSQALPWVALGGIGGAGAGRAVCLVADPAAGAAHQQHGGTPGRDRGIRALPGAGAAGLHRLAGPEAAGGQRGHAPGVHRQREP